MRVLLVSHTYLAPINHAKPRALAGHVDLTVLTPRRWPDALFTLQAGPAPAYFRSLPVLAAGRALRHVYPPAALVRLLGQIRPDLVHVEEEPPSLALAEFAALKARFGYRLTCFTWENARTPRGLAGRMEAFNMGRCCGVMAGNQEAARLLRGRGFTRPIAVIPQLGVDPEEFSPRAAEPGRALTVGYVGRLTAAKGVRVLLQAAQALPQAAFELVGGGPLQAEIRAWTQQHGLEHRVRLSPAVAHSRVPERLQALDVLVLPSLSTPEWKEQFGHILIEAMACGVAVVGSDSGAIPEVIGEAGLVVPEGDSAALAAALRRLAGDPSLRQRLAAAGRARVLAGFTHERIAQATLEFFRQAGA